MFECEICNSRFKTSKGLISHVVNKHHIDAESYYCCVFGVGPKDCLVCGRPTKFKSFEYGYRDYCSPKCASIGTVKKRKKIFLDKYGVDSPLKDNVVKNKIKETNLKRYGFEVPSSSDSIKLKVKKTCLSRYGVDNVSKVKAVKEKRKNTFLHKFGVDNPNKNKKVRLKLEATNLERYGVKCVFAAESVKEKIKSTNLSKYGVENPLSNKRVRDKCKLTLLEKYGVDHPLKVDEIKLKQKYSLRKKFNNVDFKKKILKFDKVVSRLKFCNPYFDEVDYNGVKDGYYRFKCKYCGNIFKSKLVNGKQPKCPKCFSYSSLEEIIASILNELEVKFIYRYRVGNIELDFYLPEYRLAIECNGLYWHSEFSLLKRGQDGKNYHLYKYLLCKDNGITLIQFFEDTLIFKIDIVKSMLAYKVGKSVKICGARECEIKEISYKAAVGFLDDNHLHGPDRASLRFGAFYNGRLVAVMTFRRGNISRKSNKLELSRFAVLRGYYIPGIASKLLKYFESLYDYDELITYADLTFSSGSLYKELGFEFVAKTRPNYFYFKNTTNAVRIHRYNFRKNVLSKKLDKFDPDLTEYENMLNNGYFRIWDCGHLKFMKRRNQ